MIEPKEKIVGYKVDTLGINQCVANIVSCIVARKDLPDGVGSGRWLACMNPHSYAVSLQDKQFARALRDAHWLIPDGAGIVLASRILGGHIRERVTGSDIFRGVLEQLNSIGGHSVFFLGSTEEVLASIQTKMAHDFPHVKVAGVYSPPFTAGYSKAQLDEMVSTINAVSPDVVWVGMTAPKQEKWIAEVIDQLDIGFAAAIGAVFDFYIGRVRRSHWIFRRLGLEWLPRLLYEPRRLWRRMFISAPIFVWHVIKSRFGY